MIVSPRAQSAPPLSVGTSMLGVLPATSSLDAHRSALRDKPPLTRRQLRQSGLANVLKVNAYLPFPATVRTVGSTTLKKTSR
jgi:hypothetical protein